MNWVVATVGWPSIIEKAQKRQMPSFVVFGFLAQVLSIPAKCSESEPALWKWR
jgi:hypothetical protein